MKKVLLYLFIYFFIILPNLTNAKESNHLLKRIAIIVGANNGGPTRDTLKYAVSDAQAFCDVMVEMGGCKKEETFLLINPDERNFYSAFKKAYNILKNTKSSFRKTEFIFYYSGHSDEEGMLLNNNKIKYTDLKKNIEKINADVKIAILDSCSSGAFTRIKGGKKKPPFLIDSANDMKGNAIITSSSADEASQESDRIKGSFFTHYLLSGLRGAADVTQDKKITLNEVYQFTYNETLLRTEKTIGGTQHPNYNIQMSGTGDVILTDLRHGSSLITFTKEQHGKFFIRDGYGNLTAEFKKPYGNIMTIAIPPGNYNIANHKDKNTFINEISIKANDSYTLQNKNFKISNQELTYARGANTGNSIPDKDENLLNNIVNNRSINNFFVNTNLSGYGALINKYTRISNVNAMFSGAHGGLTINNKIVLGIGAFGLSYPIERNKFHTIPEDEKLSKISFGYGGGLIEYYFMQGKILRPTIAVLCGAGALQFTSTEDEDYDSSADTFFIIEPEIKLHVNIARYFRMGTSISYRYVRGINNPYFNNSDFSNFSVSVIFAFGVF